LTTDAAEVGGIGSLATSLPHVSIHQVPSPQQKDGNPGLRLALSNLSDNVPGYHDPEILGGSSDSLERLRIDLPPDIYSSQILSTVKSPEWECVEDEEGEGEGAKHSAFRIITETSQSPSGCVAPDTGRCSYIRSMALQ
jgi:hypothetical protein